MFTKRARSLLWGSLARSWQPGLTPKCDDRGAEKLKACFKGSGDASPPHAGVVRLVAAAGASITTDVTPVIELRIFRQDIADPELQSIRRTNDRTVILPETNGVAER